MTSMRTPSAAECQQAGAEVVEAVGSRSYGMRDFTVCDPDGHRFTLGWTEPRLRDVAAHYGLSPADIQPNPAWVTARVRR